MDDVQKKAQDNEFYAVADRFIDLANTQCENEDPSFIASGMLFAAARFSAFVVASQAHDKESYESEFDRATEFFCGEYERMLKQNLAEYTTVFESKDSDT